MTPPAASRLTTEETSQPWSDGCPTAARNACGLAPVLWSCSIGGVAQALEGRGLAFSGQGSHPCGFVVAGEVLDQVAHRDPLGGVFDRAFEGHAGAADGAMNGRRLVVRQRPFAAIAAAPGGPLFFEVGVGADAGHQVPPDGEVAAFLGQGLAELSGDGARPHLVRHAAGDLDALEPVPGGGGEIVGQALDEVAAAGGIVDLVEVALLAQDVLGVDGHPAPEFVGGAERGVEGQHGDDVGAADHRGVGAGGAAEHVDPGVARGQAARRGHGVDRNAPVDRRQPAGLGDSRPQQPRRPQLGDLHEEIAPDRKDQTDAAAGAVGADTRDFQPPEVLGAGGHRDGELLHRGGAAAGVGEGGDGDRPHPGRPLFAPHHHLGHQPETGFEVPREVAV